MVDPNWASRQVVEARLKRSICLGLLVRSTKVTHPLSESPAVLEILAETFVTVTKTWSNDAVQVGGSVMLVVMTPVVEFVTGTEVLLFPPQLITQPEAIISPPITASLINC